MSILKVNDLSASLGGRSVFSGISFSADEGLTILLGRNGCGKSTLIRAILALIPSKGSISVNGKDISRLSNRERARLMSYLPQRQTIPQGISVIEYVAMGAYSENGLLISPGKEAYAAAEAELDRAGISALRGRMLTAISGGEARLAALARARVQKCRLMLMDEPLAGLDYFRQHEFMEQMRAEQTPVLMSMHDPVIAWQYADRLLVMDRTGITEIRSGDEALFQEKLTELYGKQLYFEQAGNMRLPVWHSR